MILLSGVLLASRAVFAQQPQPQDAAKPDIAALRGAFENQIAATEALAPNTQERADALLKASQNASDIAWLLFEGRQGDEAAKWFARRGELKAESYKHARAYWEKYLQVEVAEREKTFDTRIAGWQSQWEKEKNAEEKTKLRAGLEALTRMRTIERYNGISMLEALARDHDDWAAHLEYSVQELQVRREQLADLEKLQAPAIEIAVKQSELAKAYERVADARARLAFFSEAQTSYDQALKIREALPADLPERALHETYAALGAMHFHHIGEYAKARQYYERALSDFKATAPLRQKALEAEKNAELRDMKRALAVISEANITANLGSVSQELGDYRVAGEYLNRALQLSQTLPSDGQVAIFTWANAVLRARALSELSELHYAIGEIEKSRQQLEEAIAIKRAIGNDESTAGSLMQAAYLHLQSGDVEQAKRNAQQAQQIFRQAQKLHSVIAAGALLSRIARDADQLDEASSLAEEILPLARQSGAANILAGTLRSLAATRLAQKQLDAATALLDEAAQNDARVGSTLDIIDTLDLQAGVLEAQNKNEAAIEKYRQAVTLLEGVRATANSENFGEVKSHYKLYERLVLLLIKANRGEEAFDMLGRARSKKLQDDLRLTSLKTGDPALQQLLDKVSTLQAKLEAARGQLQGEQSKAARDDAKIENLQTLIASTQGEYRRVLEQIKTKNPNYEKVLTVNPKQLKEAQRSLDPDVALIQYAPLGETLYIFVVTRDALNIYAPPVAVGELWTRIKSVRAQITKPAANPLAHNPSVNNPSANNPSATRGAALAPSGANNDKSTLRENLVALHQMLLAPIEEVTRDKSTLAFIPTQLLYYLPMQALAREENGQLKYLIEEKQIAYLSAADVMKVVQAPDETRFKAGLIAFGDPTGAALPAAREEVQTISKIFPDATSLVGEAVTKAAVTDASTLGQRVVHFATHGILNANAPDQSYIQLSHASTPEAGQLTVGEVWDLPLQKVDLVTLSACQTALGEGDPSGGEITTLAEAFSSAGAQTVIASLWSVADNSTREWMVEFYTQLAAGKPKAAAYRAAQLKLLAGPEYSHPYFWAPFILMGDWR